MYKSVYVSGAGGERKRRIERVEFSFGRGGLFLVISVVKYTSVDIYFCNKIFKKAWRKRIAKKTTDRAPFKGIFGDFFFRVATDTLSLPHPKGGGVKLGKAKRGRERDK